MCRVLVSTLIHVSTVIGPWGRREHIPRSATEPKPRKQALARPSAVDRLVDRVSWKIGSHLHAHRETAGDGGRWREIASWKMDSHRSPPLLLHIEAGQAVPSRVAPWVPIALPHLDILPDAHLHAHGGTKGGEGRSRQGSPTPRHSPRRSPRALVCRCMLIGRWWEMAARSHARRSPRALV